MIQKREVLKHKLQQKYIKEVQRKADKQMASVFEMDKVDLKTIQTMYMQRVEHRHTENPDYVKKIKKKKMKAEAEE